MTPMNDAPPSSSPFPPPPPAGTIPFGKHSAERQAIRELLDECDRERANCEPDIEVSVGEEGDPTPPRFLDAIVRLGRMLSR